MIGDVPDFRDHLQTFNLDYLGIKWSYHGCAIGAQ